MNNLFKKWSVIPQRLKYKLLIAFCLMSIIPLLVLGFFMSVFILMRDQISLEQASVLVLISMLIAWLGLVLAKKLIDPIIDMSIDARIIASGDFDRKVRVSSEDEIGELGGAINILTKRVKDNIHELRDYSEKTREINIEIQKKVLALSGILQIGDLISASVELNTILDVILDKLSQLYNGGFGCVFLSREDPNEFSLRASHNLDASELLTMRFHKGEGFLGTVLGKNKAFVIDSGTSEKSEAYEFKARCKLENAVVMPLMCGKQAQGLLITGNSVRNFIYTNDDIDLIKVFVKQMSIAIENDVLLKKAEDLAIKDELTNLFNEKFISNALEEEIKRATLHQRPCSYILFNVDDFEKYREERGELAAENTLRKVADVMRKYAAPIGKAGRMGADEFSLLLPEKNKKEAMSLASKVLEEASLLTLSEDRRDRVTVSAGVSENPIDGSGSGDLLNKARHNLLEAKAKGKNTVVG